MNTSTVFRGSRVVITGAAGFIGANLIRRLLQFDLEIYGVVHKNTNLWRLQDIRTKINLVQADLADQQDSRKALSAIQPNYVYHLAVSRRNTDWIQPVQTNIAGTINVLESTATKHLKRFIHIGSSMEYGRAKTPFREESRLRPITFYGASKAAATLFAQQFAYTNRISLLVLRMFYVYGYMEPTQRLIPVATKAALCNQTFDLTDTKYRRDFLFIEDAIDACLLAAGAKAIDDGVFNIASGRQWTIDVVVAMIEAITGRTIRRSNKRYPARDWDSTNWAADIGKAKKRLGWAPKHSLEEGLKKTIKWIVERQ